MNAGPSQGVPPKTEGALQRVLGELSKEEFISKYFGRAFVPLPGRRGRFADLLDWATINDLLENHLFPRGMLRLKSAGKDVPVESFLREYTEFGRTTVLSKLSSKAVTKELRQGAMFIINQIDSKVAPIRAFADELGKELNVQVNVNMYAATCLEQHGFKRHYDAHDVLVLQAQGRKRWQVFGPRTVTPLPYECFEHEEEPPVGEPIWDEVLREGDALYLPRGWWHFAVPIGEPTVHLSVGIVGDTGMEFFEWLGERLKQSEVLRRNVPRYRSTEDDAQYVEGVRNVITNVLAEPRLLGRFREERSASEGSKNGITFGLPWSATAELVPPNLNGAIHVTSRRGLRFGPSADSPGIVDVYLGGQAVSRFGKRCDVLCEFLRAKAPVSVGAFMSAFEETFDREALREFLQELALHQVIVVKEPRDPS